MMNLYPRVTLSSGNGQTVQLNGDVLTIHQYTSVQPFDGGSPIWFQYHSGNYTRISTVPSVWDSNVHTSTMDPITAVILNLVTPEEIKMPAGIAGLLALLR